jgi:5,10-methylenetetrahydrofolate reductase
MKITDKLAKAEREGRPFWSFEFFPPRTAQVSPSTDFFFSPRYDLVWGPLAAQRLL